MGHTTRCMQQHRSGWASIMKKAGQVIPICVQLCGTGTYINFETRDTYPKFETLISKQFLLNTWYLLFKNVHYKHKIVPP